MIDGWFFALEEDVLAEGKVSEDDAQALLERTAALMEQRLASINKIAPSFSAALRGYRQATVEGEPAIAEGLLAWLGGQPNVAANVKRYANIKGDVDHDTALNFLQGLLLVLRDAGHAGLLLVLDEVETLQRVRRDIRDKGLNAFRQLLDELDQGRFPGLYLVITGTPAFYDGPQGVQRLPPLAQRLHTSFSDSTKFENPRAAQIRLAPFDEDRLIEVGRKVRDIFADSSKHADRIRRLADDDYVADLARAVAGDLGGKVGIAPRLFLRKLINEVLDLIDLNEDFDPRRDYKLTVQESELNEIERNARAASDPDDIELSL